jgi:desulfoferrodoxin (superoxide reductase-like protein)
VLRLVASGWKEQHFVTWIELAYGRVHKQAFVMTVKKLENCIQGE